MRVGSDLWTNYGPRQPWRGTARRGNRSAGNGPAVRGQARWHRLVPAPLRSGTGAGATAGTAHRPGLGTNRGPRQPRRGNSTPGEPLGRKRPQRAGWCASRHRHTGTGCARERARAPPPEPHAALGPSENRPGLGTNREPRQPQRGNNTPREPLGRKRPAVRGQARQPPPATTAARRGEPPPEPHTAPGPHENRPGLFPADHVIGTPSTGPRPRRGTGTTPSSGTGPTLPRCRPAPARPPPAGGRRRA